MRVQVLGLLTVTTPRGTARLSGARSRDVLAVLVTRRGRDVPAELILDLVWGEEASRLSAAVVHTVVSRLRRALGPDSIVTGEHGYRLAPGTRIDADEQEAALREARDLRAGGRPGPAAERYRAALALWTGPTAYDGVRDDLVQADRSRLREARALATEELAATLLQDGTPPALADARTLAVGLVEEFPFREEPVRLMMRADAGLGRQAEALQGYDRLRHRLREDLGIDPSPQTQAVHAEVLSGSTRPAGRHLRAAPRRGGRLPVPPTPTVGRERELDLIRRWHGEGHRLVTLVGPGGVGKSRLIQEFGRELGAEAVQYVDLSGAGASSARDLAQSILIAQGLGGAAPDTVAALAAALSRAQLTLLLDEAERLPDAVRTVVAEILAGCPGVRVVAASRVPLGHPAERRLPVEPLACPADGAAGATARAAPAVRLLEARLRDHAPDLLVGDDDGALLARLARRVDGLPLALELIAGQAGTRSLVELDELLAAPLDVPRAGGPADRHGSLRQALSWSVDRLSPASRVVFRRLAAFAGPFSAEAAAAVVGEPGTAEAVRALSRDGLLQVDRGGPRVRFRMLRTVHDLAGEELERHAERAAVLRRHRAWYAALWRDVPLQDEMLFSIAESYDDFRVALDGALAERDADSLPGLSVTLGWFWVFHESDAALPRLDAILGSGLLEGVDVGRVALQRRALDSAFVARPPGPDEATLRDLLAADLSWRVLGSLVDCFAAYVAGDLVQALAVAARALQLARAGAPEHVAEALATLAVMRAASGERAQALAAAEEAWQLIGAAPGVLHVSAVVSKVGLALMDAGEPRRAHAVLSQAIDSVDARLGVLVSNSLLINAGWAALGCGDPGRSARWFHRVLQRRHGLVQGHLAEAVSGAAAVLTELGAPEAAHHGEAAAELCRRHGMDLCPWLVTALARVRGEETRPTAFVAMRDDELADPVIDALHRLVESHRIGAVASD